LKPGAHRDGEASPRFKGSNFLSVAFRSPHFPAAGQDIPDFFDGPMHYGQRSPSRRKLEVSHGAAADGEQNSYR